MTKQTDKGAGSIPAASTNDAITDERLAHLVRMYGPSGAHAAPADSAEPVPGDFDLHGESIRADGDEIDRHGGDMPQIEAETRQRIQDLERQIDRHVAARKLWARDWAKPTTTRHDPVALRGANGAAYIAHHISDATGGPLRGDLGVGLRVVGIGVLLALFAGMALIGALS